MFVSLVSHPPAAMSHVATSVAVRNDERRKEEDESFIHPEYAGSMNAAKASESAVADGQEAVAGTADGVGWDKRLWSAIAKPRRAMPMSCEVDKLKKPPRSSARQNSRTNLPMA